MNEAQRITFLKSQIACAVIEAMGMQAENKQREFKGEAMAYVEQHFQEIILKHGIGHNDAISTILGAGG